MAFVLDLISTQTHLEKAINAALLPLSTQDRISVLKALVT
jgi:hypothetical protein